VLALELAGDCKGGVKGQVPRTLLLILWVNRSGAPWQPFMICAMDCARCAERRGLFATAVVTLQLHSPPVGLKPTSQLRRLALRGSTSWKANMRSMTPY
jgi:hypothetical protein